MTAVQRWGKGLVASIFSALCVMFIDFLTGTLRGDDYKFYYMIGVGVFFGWLWGSAEERKATIPPRIPRFPVVP